MNRLARVIVILTLLFSGLPFAGAQTTKEKAKKIPVLTQEERVKHAEMLDKMAEAHKKLAECLRSNKTTEECHEEMVKECPMNHEDHCPMTDEMHFFHKMHHHHTKSK